MIELLKTQRDNMEDLWNAARVIARSLQPGYSPAKRRLTPVAAEVNQYRDPNKTPPTILQIQTEGTQYTAIRRKEGLQLDELLLGESPERYPESLKMQISVASTDLVDNNIVVWMIPSVLIPTPNKRHVEIADLIDSRGEDIWDALWTRQPDLYEPREWKPLMRDIFLATRIDANVFVGNVTGFGPQTRGLNDFSELLHWAGSDNSKRVTVASQQSKTADQQQADRELIIKYGKYYVLQEGTASSQKVTGHYPKLSKAASVGF